MLAGRSLRAATPSLPPGEINESGHPEKLVLSAFQGFTLVVQPLLFCWSNGVSSIRFHIILVLALAGINCRASAAPSFSASREPGGRFADLTFSSVVSSSGLSANASPRYEDAISLSQSSFSDQRVNQQDIRQNLLQELTQQLNSIELQRIQQQDLSDRVTRAQLPTPSNQLRPQAIQSRSRSNANGPIHEYQRVSQSPQSQPDIQALLDAFDAHLEQKLARARLEGAQMERQRLEQLGRASTERSQSPRQEKPENKPSQREKLRRDRVEQHIRNSSLILRAQREGRRNEPAGQVRVSRVKDEAKQESVDQQRTDRQRQDQELREKEDIELQRPQRAVIAQTEQDHRNGEAELGSRDMTRKSRDRVGSEPLVQQNTEIRRPGTYSEEKMLMTEEQEQAFHEEQKTDIRKRDQEMMEQYIDDILRKEKERAEQTRQEHKPRERSSHDNVIHERGQVQRATQGTQQRDPERKRREQQESDTLQMYTRVETEMLEELSKKLKLLQSYARQQAQPIQSGTTLSLREGDVKPASQTSLSESLLEEIDRLWDTFQTLMRYTRYRENLQGATQQTRDDELRTPLETHKPQGDEQQDRTRNQKPSPRYRDASIFITRAWTPANRAASAAPLSDSPSGTDLSRTPTSSTDRRTTIPIPYSNSRRNDGVNDTSRTGRSYRSNNIAVRVPIDANTRMLTQDASTSSLEALLNANARKAFTEAKDEDSEARKTSDQSEAPGAFLLAQSGEISRTMLSINPARAFSSTPTVEPVSGSDDMPHTEQDNSLTGSSATAFLTPPVQWAAEASQEAKGSQKLGFPSRSPEVRRLVGIESGSIDARDATLVVDVYELEDSVDASSWKKEVINKLDLEGHIAADKPVSPRGNGSESRAFAHEEGSIAQVGSDIPGDLGTSASRTSALREDSVHAGTENDQSSNLRGLAGIRNRTKYGRSSTEADDADDLNDSVFPVIQLSTSSSRSPPSGPLQPWQGALPQRMARPTARSSAQGISDDGSTYPNTPYRTYMYYPDPFSSPYSTHSYREDYGMRYSNRYYHDTSPKAVLSWREYMRRREEKKELERRKAQEASEPTVGIIESPGGQNVGMLNLALRRSVPRYSHTGTQLLHSSAPQTAVRIPTASSVTSTTRTTFTPYSSISAARSAETQPRPGWFQRRNR
ncbi:hypothetical protein cyc_06545 [Cyclospora cayetanensis]|uniref:Uncharacterized protein n=1 Tax=Cyclospora cayetanensis TaxID=88456 RepID=A0A1D3D8T9_9EIME|nr:hypothetical protein cyc_06545 [Cyclospora cayetanensis]